MCYKVLSLAEDWLPDSWYSWDSDLSDRAGLCHPQLDSAGQCKGGGAGGLCEGAE